MIRVTAALLLLPLAIFADDTPRKNSKKPPTPTGLDKYTEEAAKQALSATPTPGAIWTPIAQFADVARDLKASQVNDLVTIVVSESASAVTSGATQTSRKSSAKSSITALAGVKSATGALANLLNTSGDQELNGSGSTSRQTAITTTMSARVVGVLPNGYLVLEGTKDVQVNSEFQTIVVRGVVRPADLASDNSVPSSRLAQVEIKLNGKGVVGDAIRRPNFLFRLLLGLLPF
ncbi:MAG TPA: flagellar basal body L-ring protein FlgH [Verrucomicrobiae bacterium]|nr:flagellar basal body L-ring protein FlgH [Verrucomicrobiae bacterium]